MIQILNITEILEYLKTSLFIYDSTEDDSGFTVERDPQYIGLTDTYLTNVLNVCLSKVNPNKKLATLNTSELYPVVLLAKKEIFFMLATKNAPLNDISIAGNAGASSLDRSQRFANYMQLIRYVEEEYNNYIETSMTTGVGGNGVQSGDVLLDSRYFSPRNYNLSSAPSLEVGVEYTTSTSADISWESVSVARFKCFKVYISTDKILDHFADKVISGTANLVKEIKDIHVTKCRVLSLIPDTTYHVAIVIEEQNGLKGYTEVEFTTLVGEIVG